MANSLQKFVLSNCIKWSEVIIAKSRLMTNFKKFLVYLKENWIGKNLSCKYWQPCGNSTNQVIDEINGCLNFSFLKNRCALYFPLFQNSSKFLFLYFISLYIYYNGVILMAPVNAPSLLSTWNHLSINSQNIRFIYSLAQFLENELRTCNEWFMAFHTHNHE